MQGVIAAGLQAAEGRADANETMVFARQLEHVYSKVYEIKKLPSVFREFAPINREVSNADEAHTFREVEGFGEAKILDGYRSKDFPSVELQGKEVSGVVKSVGASYSYTIQDMRRAAQTGMDLSMRKAKLARDIIERKLDALAFNGDALAGFTGIADLSNILSVSAINGDWANATRTAQEIVDDVLFMAESMFEATKGECTGKVLLLPTKAFKKVMYKDLPGSGGSLRSKIAEYLMAGVPGLERILHAPRLATEGGSSKERIMLVDNNPEVLEAVIAQEFEQWAPQQNGLAWDVMCHARWGGWKVHQPKGVAYMDGTEA